ncbi:MAG: cupin-like domain-containing protein [Alteromonadaceae bacterium]|nr:cupin-like domain-containing protein [Alteromonadaceae bacterium]
MLQVAHTIDELNGITSGNVDENILYSKTPIVLRGFCKEWPLVEQGLKSDETAADYLMQHYSGEPVHASYGAPENNGRIFYNQDISEFNFARSKIHLGQLFATIFEHKTSANPPTAYVASTDAKRWFPDLLTANSCAIPNANPIVSFWIGNQSRIAAHYDFPTNVACNVVGRRRFTLFPPDQISNLYPGPIEFAPGGQEISMVDFAEPDFQKYPKFRNALANAQITELAPGDALIIPSMWWHHVEALSTLNVLITHWWRDTPAYMGKPNNALLAAILSLRSLPKEQRDAWKHIFDHYIFDAELDDHKQIPDSAKDILSLPIDELAARKLRADILNKYKR